MARTASGDTTEAPATGTVADNVRAELARRRKSGRDLAAVHGWSERTLRRRLGGVSPFTVDELAATAKHLGIPITDLLPRGENP